MDVLIFLLWCWQSSAADVSELVENRRAILARICLFKFAWWLLMLSFEILPQNVFNIFIYTKRQKSTVLLPPTSQFAM